MKKVMRTAWALAKGGQKRFGGNVKEYFAQALKMAWALCKKAQKAHKQVIIKNENGTHTIERYQKGKVVETKLNLNPVSYRSVYQDFYKRGANMIEFFVGETYTWTNELDPYTR